MGPRSLRGGGGNYDRGEEELLGWEVLGNLGGINCFTNKRGLKPEQ